MSEVTTAPDVSVQDAGMAAMDRGWKVFPVRGKIPATANGLHDATTDRGRLHGWWGLHDDRGLALATGEASGVWALDLDGEEGRSAVRELTAEHGELPETVASRTGGGGFHLLFQMSEGTEIRNSAGMVAPGVDVRGTGGYIVLPPSPHPSGNHYAWLDGRSPDDLPVADAPDWLVELVTAGKDGRARPAPAVEEAIPQGQRNATLASLAGTMRRRGMEAPEIEAALQAANRRRCEPPLPEEEVADIAVSIGRYAPAPASENGARPPGGGDATFTDHLLQGRQNGGFLDSLDAEWGAPVPLGPGDPDPYSVEALPGWVRRHVESVADACQVPSDLPFLLSLTAISTAAANKVVTSIRPGHTEPAFIWTCSVLPPGSRKSPTYKHLMRPLKEYEADRAEETAPERRRAIDEREVAEKALERAKREAAKATTEEAVAETRQALREARDRLERLEVPTVPRLVASDVTSEKLARLMEENAGRIAVLAPEGDIFRIMAGRYSGSVNFDHYKRGWTGDEPIRDDRMGRDGTHVRRPALTLGLTVQPSVLDTLEAKDSFRGEGLLGRFLYAVPDSGIGRRLTGADVPELDREAARVYDRRLRELLEAGPRDVDERGDFVPHELTLAPEARSLFFDFEGYVEKQMGPGGDLEHVPDWGGKLPGHVARVAALLHGARRVGQGAAPWRAPVSVEAMRGAVAVGRAAVDHALRIFDRLEMDPEVRLAKYLLRRIRSLKADREKLTQSDLLQAVKQKRGLETAEKVEDILAVLARHNLVRAVPQPSDGPGRPPSPEIKLHPDTTTDVQEIQETPPRGSDDRDEPGSVDFLDAERGAGVAADVGEF